MSAPCCRVSLTASYVVRRRLAFLALAAPLAAGCYTYTAAQPGSIAPGVSVRARITPAAGANIAPILGTTPRLLTGKVISDLRDTVIVEVPAVAQAEIGSAMQTLHQRVSLPKAEVVEWEIRTLNRPRTFALVGGAAAIAAMLLIKALKGEPGSEGLPDGGGTDALVPVFRVIR